MKNLALKNLTTNNYYVYTLAYPDGTVFYVGKGLGDRMRNHLKGALNGTKSDVCDVIRQIWQDGGEVITKMIHVNLSQEDAYILEARTIKELGYENLTNKRHDHGYNCGSRQTSAEWAATLAYTMSFAGENVRWFSAEQVSRLAGKPPSYWQKCAADGQVIGAKKIGKTWLFPESGLVAFGIPLPPPMQMEIEEVD